MLPTISDAAVSNAVWCDLMNRLHGGTGVFSPRAWTSPSRTPPFYPDAVTLAPGVSAADLLADIDAGEGCSVKDSYADLDLAPSGFKVLFDAQWVGSPPLPGTMAAGWRPVTTPAELADWAQAWGGGTDDHLFLPALLAEPGVAVLWNGRAGGIVNRGGDAAGISNVFAGDEDQVRVWHDLLSVAAALFPRLPVVGYERGDDLAAALAAGLRPIGDLRVWLC